MKILFGLAGDIMSGLVVLTQTKMVLHIALTAMEASIWSKSNENLLILLFRNNSIKGDFVGVVSKLLNR